MRYSLKKLTGKQQSRVAPFGRFRLTEYRIPWVSEGKMCSRKLNIFALGQSGLSISEHNGVHVSGKVVSYGSFGTPGR